MSNRFEASKTIPLQYLTTILPHLTADPHLQRPERISSCHIRISPAWKMQFKYGGRFWAYFVGNMLFPKCRKSQPIIHKEAVCSLCPEHSMSFPPSWNTNDPKPYHFDVAFLVGLYHWFTHLGKHWKQMCPTHSTMAAGTLREFWDNKTGLFGKNLNPICRAFFWKSCSATSVLCAVVGQCGP